MAAYDAIVIGTGTAGSYLAPLRESHIRRSLALWVRPNPCVHAGKNYSETRLYSFFTSSAAKRRPRCASPPQSLDQDDRERPLPAIATHPDLAWYSRQVRANGSRATTAGQVRDQQNPLAHTPALPSRQAPQLRRPRFAAKEIYRHRPSPKHGMLS